MRYYKVLAFCVLLFFQCSFSIDAFSQCDSKIEYKTDSKVKGVGELSLKSLDGSKDVRIQLYDLNSGKVVNEVKVKVDSQYKVAFKNIQPSVYMLYVWALGCNKPTVIGGGKQGILIEN